MATHVSLLRARATSGERTLRGNRHIIGRLRRQVLAARSVQNIAAFLLDQHIGTPTHYHVKHSAEAFRLSAPRVISATAFGILLGRSPGSGSFPSWTAT